MNDHHENDHDHDEQAILRAVDGLSTTDAASPPPTLPADDAAVREYAELLALLPYAEPPAAPDPALRGELLGRLAPASPTPLATTHEPARAGASVVPIDRRPAVASIGRGWPLALAAALAACVLGLVFLAGQIGEQREAIARLETAGQEVARQARALDEQLQRREKELRMVTVTAKRVYPVRPAGTGPGSTPVSDRAPEGRIYVCGRHQQWFLTVHDLPPAPQGREYRLWFITDEGPIDGGAIDVVGKRPVEQGAPFMPEGTHAFQVTLENRGQSEEPRGQAVLIADRSIRL